MTEYVTLVPQGGQPVRLGNQTGAPWPTTGTGSLVFSDGATLTDVTLTDVTYTGGAAIIGNLSVSGTSTLTGDVTMASDLTLTGTLNGSPLPDYAISVEDLAALKALTLRPESVLVKTGQAAGTWQWVLGSTTTANDGTVVTPTSGTAGRYKRVYDGPIYTAWFGTGITSLVAAWAVSKDLVCTPGEIYEFTNITTHSLGATDETINIEAGQSTFKIGVANMVMFAPVGSWSSIQNVSLINGAVLTVSDGSVFTKGDVVKVVDETPLWHYRLGAKNGEFAVVLSVSGNDVTLARPLEYSAITLPPAFITANSLAVTGAANNGVGLIRITAAAHGYANGMQVSVQDVAGTVEADGIWIISGVTTDTFDLVGSTFANAYVSGGTVYPTFQYSVANTCRIGKIGTAPCRVNIGTVSFPTNITSIKGMLRPEARMNIDIRIGYQNYVDGIAIQPVSCYGGRCEIDMLVSGETNSGYGINLSNCEAITAVIGASGTVRHAADGGGGTGAGVSLSEYGHSAYNRVNGFCRGSPDGAFVTHHGTYRWSFENCRSVGSASCVAVRGVGHIALNPESVRDAGAFGMFNQYDETESCSDDITIIKPMVREAQSSAIGFNTGSRGYVRGGIIEYTASTGTRLFEIGGEMTMTGTQINVFGVLSNRVFLAMDAGAALLDLNDVTIDFASNALPSRLIDDLVGSGMVVRAKDVFIRNSSTATYFFRGTGNLPSGSEIRNLEFTGDLTLLVFGQTWSTIQPYIYGPVIVAGIEQMTRGFLQFGQPLTYTIAAGAISVLGTNCVIDTEGGAGTDDLNTITVPTGTPDGTIVSLRSASPSRDPTVKNGTGNIALGADRTLTSPTDSVLLCYRLATNDFVGVAFSDNA